MGDVADMMLDGTLCEGCEMENKLGKEVLALYVKLQPQIREMMGEWKVRDIGYVDGLGIGILHANGLMYFSSGTSINPTWGKDIVWIPPAINTFNPGYRDLWGMVDWSGWALGSTLDGEVFIQHRQTPIEIKAPVTLALLKAIVAQGAERGDRTFA